MFNFALETRNVLRRGKGMKGRIAWIVFIFLSVAPTPANPQGKPEKERIRIGYEELSAQN
jgi:hypothetical protein